MAGPMFTTTGRIECRDYCVEPSIYCQLYCCDPQEHEQCIKALAAELPASQAGTVPNMYDLLHPLELGEIIQIECLKGLPGNVVEHVLGIQASILESRDYQVVGRVA